MARGSVPGMNMPWTALSLSRTTGLYISCPEASGRGVGELRYKDQDSEQELTTLAWRARCRRRRSKGKDGGNEFRLCLC